jgi:hypothetical protein
LGAGRSRSGLGGGRETEPPAPFGGIDFGLGAGRSAITFAADEADFDRSGADMRRILGAGRSVMSAFEGCAAVRGGSAPLGAGRSASPPPAASDGMKSRSSPGADGRVAPPLGAFVPRSVDERPAGGGGRLVPDGSTGGAGTIGGAGTSDGAGSEGNPTRDLQLVQVRNFAPVGISDSLTRLMFPHVVQVASIIA